LLLASSAFPAVTGKRSRAFFAIGELSVHGQHSMV